MNRDSFTERHGVAPRSPQQEVSTVPDPVRHGLVYIINNCGINHHIDLDRLFTLVYKLVFTRPSVARTFRFREALPDMPYLILGELEKITQHCSWNVLFDIAEACADAARAFGTDALGDFEYNFNELLLENGIQWVMKDGKVERRRAEPVAGAIEKVLASLQEAGLLEPDAQLRKAIRALDERPIPDVENAGKDAVGALEGTARTLVGKPSASLSSMLANEPFKSNVHPILKDVLLKTEAYRHDAPGAGHAMVASKPKIQPEDAEFVLTTCIAGIHLLLGKAKETS